ncbi:facilitated trehalose transporter Tret1 [Halyomorpha halys]|uniref:facilitated trehalose transporter Tret1 n=1 Tax=Halyomorpha halys TaxID=286706 RepID=UPI0006D52590|nr:facilitated trehalose transporter Tret1-like [Halyomorpha halys]
MFSSASFRQYLVASIGGLSLFVSGTSYTWATPLLPYLKKNDSEFHLTADEGSWVISLIEIGNLLPCIPAGLIADKFGRKPCLLYTTPFYILTWLFVLWYRTVPALYTMRIVQGLAMAVQFTVLPMYLAEIADSSRRGALGSLFQIMWYLGFLYEYIFGAFFGYDGLTWFSVGPPIVFMVSFYFCPESPYFLLMKERHEEATKTLAWLRGQSLEEVEPEVKTINQMIVEEKQEEASWRDVVGTAAGRKALLVILMLGIMYIMSGISTILCYISEIFGTTSGSQNEGDMATIFVGTAILLTTCLSTCLVDRLGRRPVVICSTAMAAIFLTMTSVYYYIYEKTHIDTSGYTWVPYTSILFFTTIMSIGIGAIPALQGELFPNSTRGIASGIYTLVITALSFVCLKMYQVIGDYYGYYIDYLVFAFFCACTSLYMYIFLPETKGMTFVEIQKILQGDKR